MLLFLAISLFHSLKKVFFFYIIQKKKKKEKNRIIFVSKFQILMQPKKTYIKKKKHTSKKTIQKKKNIHKYQTNIVNKTHPYTSSRTNLLL